MPACSTEWTRMRQYLDGSWSSTVCYLYLVLKKFKTNNVAHTQRWMETSSGETQAKSEGRQVQQKAKNQRKCMEVMTKALNSWERKTNCRQRKNQAGVKCNTLVAHWSHWNICFDLSHGTGVGCQLLAASKEQVQGTMHLQNDLRLPTVESGNNCKNALPPAEKHGSKA